MSSPGPRRPTDMTTINAGAWPPDQVELDLLRTLDGPGVLPLRCDVRSVG